MLLHRWYRGREKAELMHVLELGGLDFMGSQRRELIVAESPVECA